MKIKTISSSSSGCCYVIESGGKKILIECGIPLKQIRKALDYDLSNVVGCLVSHSHGDHAKYLTQLERETSIPIWCNQNTKDTWKLQTSLIFTLYDGWMGNDDFIFKTVELDHDAPCYGFIVSDHKDLLFYATDTKSVNYTIPGLKYLLIEANHSMESLIESEKNGYYVKRAADTHLDIDDVEEFVSRHKDLEEIWLVHLSSCHADSAGFKRRIQKISGCLVYIAEE